MHDSDDNDQLTWMHDSDDNDKLTWMHDSDDNDKLVWIPLTEAESFMTSLSQKNYLDLCYAMLWK